jgi:hypothetical protein
MQFSLAENDSTFGFALKVDFSGNEFRVGSCDFVDALVFLDKRNNPRNHTKLNTNQNTF